MTDSDGRASSVGWTDSHCHLQDTYLGGDALGDGDGGGDGDGERRLRAVLDRAAGAGVTRAVCIGTDAASSREAVRIASLPDLPIEVFATVGLHPHEASTSTAGLDAVLDAPGAERVVAIGECGLDYYYEHSPRDVQRSALREQLAMALARDLAVVLHVRDAFGDLFGVLDDVGVPERTIVHCFSAGPSEARRCVEAGLFVSVAGIITFKNAQPLRDALAEVPLDRLLVETDSPFLAPVPHRGQPNEPAFVADVGHAVAQTLNLDLGVVRRATTLNASRVFRLPDPS
ncbi:MAG TPA: TatD family hydrolase [Acidimicrobiales bacterium]|nr:TatD family hydrolase [Acidimicrobiales bacterium]